MIGDAVVDETTGEILLEPEGIAEGEDGCQRCDYERRRADAHERRADSAGTAYHDLDREARNLRRRVATLETELAKQREDDPDMSTAKAIAARWVEESGRNPKTTKFTDKRQKAVLARLRQYEGDFVMEAVVAGVRTANASSKEAEREALIASLHEAIRLLGDDTEEAKALRAFYRAKTKNVVRFDDLELICRDPINLERAHAAAVRMGIAQGV